MTASGIETSNATSASMSAAPTQRMGRVPALDGLRAVAVLMVLASHMGPLRAHPGDWKLHGGFFGVDIFFVLSGFLITTLLLEEQARGGTTRIGSFYRRRAMRLLPVVVMFLAAHVVFTQIVLNVSGAAERRALSAALLFTTNWYAIDTQPVIAFGHLWSLAVEEQFYLVWPVVMVVLGARARFRTIMVVLGGAIVAIALHRFAQWDAANASQVMLRTDTHADGLLIGALVAHVRFRGITKHRLSSAMAGCAAVTIAASAIWVRPTAALLFRGGYTVVAVAAAIVVYAIVETDWLGGRFLEAAPLRAIGRVSYGLYVWHPLVFWWTRSQLPASSDAVRLVVALGATAAVAATSWWLVEQPMLRWKDRLEVRAGTARRARIDRGSPEHLSTSGTR